MIAVNTTGVPRIPMPMEARVAQAIPVGDQWLYEPKWDGFRCIARREGDDVQLQSKAGKPLARYFPDVVATLKSLKARRFMLDGEIVVPINKEFSFDALLMRIHPAASRIQKLARETPARYIVFDLLMDERGTSWSNKPLEERRAKLEAFAHKYFASRADITLSPATRNITAAKNWLKKPGLQRDGVIAKRLDMPYMSGERTGMMKIKRMRTADCVVGGFRYASGTKIIGSLLLGLYDEQGLLHHVGFTSSLNQRDRERLTPKLEKLKRSPERGGGFTGRAPGGPSRWSTDRSSEWEPIAPKLVVEVQYDHFTGGRFRHGTKFLRWRPEKSPKQCTFDQLQIKSARNV